nr:hypothetical protein BaRGS_009869 [Batillaria attramentaria]
MLVMLLKLVAPKIVDTPGVSDTHHNHEDILREISKFTATMSPGPDAILMVVSGIHRFTEEEYKAYLEAKKLFGEDLASRTIIVFTGGDELQRKGVRIEDQIEKGSDNLKQMMKELDNRYIVLNNNASDEGEKRKQITELFSSIEGVRKSVGTQTFNSPMMNDVGKLADEAAEKVAKDKKLPKADARRRWNEDVMKVGTEESAKEPYKFAEVKDKVKHETNKNKVVVKLCVIL